MDTGRGRIGRMGRYACLVLAFSLCALLYKEEIHAENPFGADAYTYMEYLSTQFPQRWAGTQTVAQAREWLTATVQGFGYQEVRTEYCEGVSPLGWGEYAGYNLIFTKRGTGEKRIVVCAHYDSTSTNGADDNASGVGVLLETAKRVFSEELPYTVDFILFDAEEPGCLGSRYYVSHASQEYLDNILCVINVDTVAAGDVMYAYGGDVDAQGSFTRTWALWRVIELSQELGIDLRTHPEVNPSYPSPTKRDGSDQTAFNEAGIPYVYFEASCWQGGDYTNFCQTADPRVPNGKIMHVPEFDNLTFINEAFPGRAAQHLSAYTQILYETLHRLTDPSQMQPEESSSETPEESTGEASEESAGEAPEDSTDETSEESTGGVPEESTDETSEENSGGGSEESTDEASEDIAQSGKTGEETSGAELDPPLDFSQKPQNADGNWGAFLCIAAIGGIGFCGIIWSLGRRR